MNAKNFRHFEKKGEIPPFPGTEALKKSLPQQRKAQDEKISEKINFLRVFRTTATYVSKLQKL